MWSATRPLLLGLMAFALVTGACTPAATQPPASATPSAGASIVGTWKCGPPEGPSRREDDVELRADGMVTNDEVIFDRLDVNQRGPTTWSVDGNRGAFHFPDGDDPFTIEADRIVFDDGFVCTRAS